MARPKEFDRTKALDKAMHLFWEQGYEATSIQDLCEHKGINRGSLYDTFGDKHSLFVETLLRYRDLNMSQTDSSEGALFGLIGIRQLFSEIVEASIDDLQQSGCFFVNTTAELASHDVEVATLCIENRRGYETMFVHLLTQAEEANEIAKGRDLRQLARFLVNTIYGIRITAKTTNDREILEDIMKAAVSILR